MYAPLIQCCMNLWNMNACLCFGMCREKEKKGGVGGVMVVVGGESESSYEMP